MKVKNRDTELPVKKLYPHPDNPRKNVGDVTEYYKDAPEYQSIFFKAKARKKGNRPYKKMAQGRKIACNGFTLYYEDKELTPETLCTEEISGYSGQYRIFQNTYTAKFIREKNAQLEYKNVRELPYEDGGMAENMNS